jgi:hypothetical protein
MPIGGRSDTRSRNARSYRTNAYIPLGLQRQEFQTVHRPPTTHAPRERLPTDAAAGSRARVDLTPIVSPALQVHQARSRSSKGASLHSVGSELSEAHRLADAGLTREQRHGGGDQPTAEDAVDAGKARRDPSFVRVIVGERLHGCGRCGVAAAAFLDRPPRAAAGAASRPLRELLPAVAAREHRAHLAHRGTVATGSDSRARRGMSATEDRVGPRGAMSNVRWS